jgi:hypothetical protein
MLLIHMPLFGWFGWFGATLSRVENASRLNPRVPSLLSSVE